jgi:hypothetical protein
VSQRPAALAELQAHGRGVRAVRATAPAPNGRALLTAGTSFVETKPVSVLDWPLLDEPYDCALQKSIESPGNVAGLVVVDGEAAAEGTPGAPDRPTARRRCLGTW